MEPITRSFDPISNGQTFDFEEYPDFQETFQSPIVGQMTDDNQDGVISNDVPDVDCYRDYNNFHYDYQQLHHGVMRLISGDGSAIHWSVFRTLWTDGEEWFPHWITNPAIGDLDNDGEPEIAMLVSNTDIVSFDKLCHIAIYDRFGTLEYVNLDVFEQCAISTINLADMDNDGTVEIVFGSSIYNGEDATLQGAGEFGSGAINNGDRGPTSFPIDLDGDGYLELITGNTIYDHLGNTICQLDEWDAIPTVADIDGDGFGEIITTGRNKINIYEHDCWFVRRWIYTILDWVDLQRLLIMMVTENLRLE